MLVRQPPTGIPFLVKEGLLLEESPERETGMLLSHTASLAWYVEGTSLFQSLFHKGVTYYIAELSASGGTHFAQ